MIKKELGFIYLEKNEIAYYMANLWMSECVGSVKKLFFNVILSLQKN